MPTLQPPEHQKQAPLERLAEIEAEFGSIWFLEQPQGSEAVPSEIITEARELILSELSALDFTQYGSEGSASELGKLTVSQAEQALEEVASDPELTLERAIEHFARNACLNCGQTIENPQPATKCCSKACKQERKIRKQKYKRRASEPVTGSDGRALTRESLWFPDAQVPIDDEAEAELQKLDKAQARAERREKAEKRGRQAERQPDKTETSSRPKFTPQIQADCIQELNKPPFSKRSFIFIDGIVYRWTSSGWRPTNDNVLHEALAKLIAKKMGIKVEAVSPRNRQTLADAWLNAPTASELNKYFEEYPDSRERVWDLEKNETVEGILWADGILKIDSDNRLQFKKIKRRYWSSIASVPAKWAEADTENIEDTEFYRFLLEAFEGDTERIFWLASEIGRSLMQSTAEQQFVLLIGEGGTGKSSLLKILQGLIGSEAVDSRTTIEGLGERFQATLAGKKLLVLPDVGLEQNNKNYRNGQTILKQISGADAIQLEPKGRERGQNRVLPITIWISTNYVLEFTRDADEIGAYQRRMVPFQFTSKPPKNKDDRLVERILSNERDTIARWAVEQYSARKQQKLSIPESIVQKRNQLITARLAKSDRFWFEKIEVTHDLKDALSREDLQAEYRAWCDLVGELELDKNGNLVGSRKISTMAQQRCSRDSGPYKKDGKSCRTYYGLKLKQPQQYSAPTRAEIEAEYVETGDIVDIQDIEPEELEF